MRIGGEKLVKNLYEVDQMKPDNEDSKLIDEVYLELYEINMGLC